MRFHSFRERRSWRWFLHFGSAHGPGACLHGEVDVRVRNSAYLEVDLAHGGDSTFLGVTLSFFLFFFYIGFDHHPLHCWLRDKIKRRGERYGNGRTVGIRWYEDVLWINLWNDPMESRKSDPQWWHITICPVDIIFGRTRYETVQKTTERVVIPMPEGGYPATVKLYEARWRRPRWPFVWGRMQRADVTPENPIPFPGKGENSWDCGEDATFSMTCQADTALEAAMKMSKSVMESRLRYGGGWQYKPEKVWTQR